MVVVAAPAEVLFLAAQEPQHVQGSHVHTPPAAAPLAPHGQAPQQLQPLDPLQQVLAPFVPQAQVPHEQDGPHVHNGLVAHPTVVVVAAAGGGGGV